MLPGAAQRLSRWIHLVSDLRQDYFHPGAVDPNLDMFQLAVAGSVSRDEAEQNAREVKKLIGENALVTFETESKSWGLLVARRFSREEGEELRARLEDSGFDVSLSSLSQRSSCGDTTLSTQEPKPGKVRLASRPSSPSRELVTTMRFSRAQLIGGLIVLAIIWAVILFRILSSPS